MGNALLMKTCRINGQYILFKTHPSGHALSKRNLKFEEIFSLCSRSRSSHPSPLQEIPLVELLVEGTNGNYKTVHKKTTWNIFARLTIIINLFQGKVKIIIIRGVVKRLPGNILAFLLGSHNCQRCLERSPLQTISRIKFPVEGTNGKYEILVSHFSLSRTIKVSIQSYL